MPTFVHNTGTVRTCNTSEPTKLKYFKKGFEKILLQIPSRGEDEWSTNNFL